MSLWQLIMPGSAAMADSQCASRDEAEVRRMTVSTMHTRTIIGRHICCTAVVLVALASATSSQAAGRDTTSRQQPQPPPQPPPRPPVAPPTTAPVPPVTSAPSVSPQTLPGGATQVQETHGDWRVTCVQQNNQKVCAFSQQLADKDSRQLVLGIELKATTADRADGTMVLPFGLAVDQPVTLQIDEGGSAMPMRFKTCVPVGCLVTLTLDPTTTAALRRGSVLNVKATASDTDQDTSFKVSLKGFGSAIDRT